MRDEDLAVRGNFCTLDEDGQVIDRRAGRIETAHSRELCKKLRAIDLPGEEVDQKIPRVLNLGPDVLIVTGDHSTPASLKSHSWHPVPVLLQSRYCRPDGVDRFGERDCIKGGLGPRFPVTDLMPLALANALRLKKFGA